MLKNRNLWIGIVVFLVAGVVVKILFPFSVEAVRASVAVAPEVLFDLGPFPVTPTIITSVIVFILIALFAVFSTRSMQLVPAGLQNLAEVIVEQLVNLFEGISGPMWQKFFAITASIFILVLVSNFIGLIPGAGSIGVIRVEEGHPVPGGIFIVGDAPSFLHPYTLFSKAQEAKGVPADQIEESVALSPFVRAPSSDINLPLALAIVSVFMTQVYGMQAQGLRYWTRFFSFGRLLKGNIAMGLIDIFVGLVELVSEIFKLVSFTFRLFGNIFAGEVILLIMAFLFVMLPLPFYGLEFFVAFIQAFVFAVLTAAFMRIATAEHGGGGHEGQAQH